MSHYKPAEGTLTADVCAWFRANPQCQELTIANIVQIMPGKAKTSNVNACLATAVTHRVLDRTRNRDGDLVYRRGRAFDGAAPSPAPGADLNAAWTPQAAATPAPVPIPSAPVPAPVPTPAPPPPAEPRKPSTLTGGAVKRLPDIDLTAVPVIPNLPMPAPQSRRGHSRYDELFDRLLDPGNGSFLPRSYLGALKQAAVKYSKRTGRRVQAYATPEHPDKCVVLRLADKAPAKTTSQATSQKATA